jgi:hypothetical protein
MNRIIITIIALIIISSAAAELKFLHESQNLQEMSDAVFKCTMSALKKYPLQIPDTLTIFFTKMKYGSWKNYTFEQAYEFLRPFHLDIEQPAKEVWNKCKDNSAAADSRLNSK